MKESIICMAEMTEWIDVEYYKNPFALVSRVIEDINISINVLLNKASEGGVFCEGANVFLKKDLIKGGENLRMYVTICGKNEASS